MISLAKLIPLLIQKTEEGKLDWQPVSYGIRVDLAGKWIVLETENNTGWIVLFDQSGNRLEDMKFNIYTDEHGLDKLYELARKKAYRIEESIEEVEQLLKAM